MVYDQRSSVEGGIVGGIRERVPQGHHVRVAFKVGGGEMRFQPLVYDSETTDRAPSAFGWQWN